MCDCIDIIQKRLRDDPKINTELDIPAFYNLATGKLRTPRVAIAVLKRDQKSRIPLRRVIPLYCPFCGKAYIVSDEPDAPVTTP